MQSKCLNVNMHQRDSKSLYDIHDWRKIMVCWPFTSRNTWRLATGKLVEIVYLSNWWARSFATAILVSLDSPLTLTRSIIRFWFSSSEPISSAMFRKLPIIVFTWPTFSSISSSRASFVILFECLQHKRMELKNCTHKKF